MRICLSEVTRKNSTILMQKIFTQDISKLLKNGFHYYSMEKHDPKIGKTLVEFLGLFYELLEDYSKGRILKI